MSDTPQSNHQAVYYVVGGLVAVALAIIGADVWLRSQGQEGIDPTLVALVPVIVVGLLTWLAPSPLKNPAQPAVDPPAEVFAADLPIDDPTRPTV